MANDAGTILSRIKDEEIDWVDLRFTDPKGKWQHLTMASGMVDEDQLTAAQGVTGSTAAGIQVFLEEGAWTKRFHPGWGAVAGITAANLVKHGFKGPSRPYEGKFGLFDTHLHGEEVKIAPLTEGLGSVWHFGETALKPYPVCHFIHGCDACSKLS